MKSVARVEFFRMNPNASDANAYIMLAEALFPSWAKCSQYLHRLGFIFETWKYEDDQLKFRNSDTGEIALVTPLEDQ